MAVQLYGITVQLSNNVGVSLTSSTMQIPWSGESLLSIGVSIIQSSVTIPSTVVLNSSSVMSLQFNLSSNSGMVALLVGTV